MLNLIRGSAVVMNAADHAAALMGSVCNGFGPRLGDILLLVSGKCHGFRRLIGITDGNRADMPFVAAGKQDMNAIVQRGNGAVYRTIQNGKLPFHPGIPVHSGT